MSVGCIAESNIQFLQLGQCVLMGNTTAVSSAFKRPVMKDNQVIVGRRMNIELHDGRAIPECLRHGGNRVFNESVRGRINTVSRAGVIFYAGIGVRLCHSSMSNSVESRRTRRQWSESAGDVDGD